MRIRVLTVCLSLLISPLSNHTSARAESALLPEFVSVSSGYQYSCAITKSAEVYCWGVNDYSQQGRSDYTNSLVPGKVAGLSGVKKVVAGFRHTCALLEAGTVRCWGDNSDGQVGDGRLDRGIRFFPVFVHNVFGAVDIALGENHSCAALNTGEVKCWGSNQTGQLGIGAAGDDQLLPQSIKLDSAVVAVAAGANHSCAITSLGEVHCWGSNEYGQLGIGNFESKSAPTRVTSISGAKALKAKFDRTCVNLSDGIVNCWGNGQQGQIGNGDAISQKLPSKVNTPKIQDFTAGFSLGNFHTCLLENASLVWCWGQAGNNLLGWGDASAPTAYTPGFYLLYSTAGSSSISGVKQLDAGFDHSCGVLNDGTIYCWGSNGRGQLGLGSTTPASVQRAPLNGVIAPPYSPTIQFVDDLAQVTWTRDLVEVNWSTKTLTSAELQATINVTSNLGGLTCQAVKLSTCFIGPLKPAQKYTFSIWAENALSKSKVIQLSVETPATLKSASERVRDEVAAKAKADAEAKLKAEEEALKAQQEAKAKAEAEAKQGEIQKLADAAKAKELEELRIKQEQEAKIKAEREQKITLPLISSQNLTTALILLGAEVRSNLRITAKSKTPKVCEGVSGLLPKALLLGAGNCVITLSQAGNALFDAAPDVDVSFQVIDDRKKVKSRS